MCTDVLRSLNFDVKGWVVAFNVKIDQVDLHPDSEEYQHVRSKIQQPGDFSIKSLFLTFNCKYRQFV